MIKIYFDNILLNDDNYISFEFNKKSFDKEFYLGSVASVQASLKIPKDALPSTLENVKIEVDNNVILNLIIDKIEINDDEEAILSLVDKLLSTEVGYDFSDYTPISAKDLLTKICIDFNIPYDTFSFTNDDIIISSYDNTITARQYISMIAEIAGGYAEIDNNGKLKIKTYSNQNITNEITIDDIDNYKLGEEITIERVVYQFGNSKKETSSDESLYTVYLNSNNIFLQMMDDSQFTSLCDNILGFSFYNINIPTTNKFFFNKEVIHLVEGSNIYTILNECAAEYMGGFVGSYDSSIESTKENETKLISNTEKINRIKSIVDQQNGQISTVVEKVDGYNSRVSRLEQNAEDLEIIISRDSDDNITGVKTSSGFTFDINGLDIYTDENSYNTQINNIGTYYKDGETIISQTTKDGTITKDIVLYGRYYYGVDEDLAVENFTKNDSMFVAMKFTDENREECFGHFYNGE